MFKESVVKTIERSSLIGHRARRRDRMQGGLGSATLPSEPGLAAVANEAAPHQTDADAAAARGPSSSDLTMVEIDANEVVEGSSSLIDFDHGYGDDDDDISVDETLITRSDLWQGFNYSSYNGNWRIIAYHDMTHFSLRKFCAPDGDRCR